MQETFHQYHLITELANKYSHSTYLASPTNEHQSQMVLTLFASSLFHFPHEHENLLKKVQCIQDIEHPHVASILDMGIEQEQPFVVREYWPNGSLRSRMKQIAPDHLELADALTIVFQVGEALAYAHQHNIVHGNIKPENILFDANGQIILTDFSLVGSKDALMRDQISQEYAFCYLAPEQFAGVCDSRSDQYALGCLAYELITGRVPFASQGLTSIMGQPSNAQPAPLSERVADLPPLLEMAVLKTLANDPDQRFFDFSLFLEAIQSVLSSPPAFPLFRSPSSEKKRIISHGVPSTNIEITSLPIHKDATRRTAERSGTPSHSEASALMVETMTSSEDFPDEQAIDTPTTEQEPETLWLTDPFEEEEDLPARVDASSTEFTSRTQGRRPMRVFVQHSRRKGLELGLVLSVIVAMVCSALWLSGIVKPELDSPMPKISLRLTKKTRQVVATQTTNTSPVQSSVEITPFATILPSAQATLPITQSAVDVNSVNIPETQSSSALVTPTPQPPISYEAEASQNILAGGAAVGSCSGCSGGAKVINLGLHNGSDGTLQFTNVSKQSAGTDTLTIYYLDAASDRVLYMSLNGGSAIALTASGTGNRTTIAALTVTVMLHAGNNTIEFSNPSAYAPDIDRIVV